LSSLLNMDRDRIEGVQGFLQCPRSESAALCSTTRDAVTRKKFARAELYLGEALPKPFGDLARSFFIPSKRDSYKASRLEHGYTVDEDN